MKCYGCTERFVGCHSNCPAYQEYVAEKERIRRNKRIQKEYYNYKHRITYNI